MFKQGDLVTYHHSWGPIKGVVLDTTTDDTMGDPRYIVATRDDEYPHDPLIERWETALIAEEHLTTRTEI